jgi:DNA-binding NarL/FixJ family response regulator
MEQPVTIVVVDDSRPARSGLQALLTVSPQVKVIGEAANGQEAITLIEQQQPQVVLMDAQMPGMDGIQVAQIIKQRWPAIKVIILTMYPAYETQVQAAGVDGFLIKGGPVDDLLRAVLGSPNFSADNLLTPDVLGEIHSGLPAQKNERSDLNGGSTIGEF